MKTNYSDLTTRCEAPASTSKLFAYYSYGNESILTDGQAMFRVDGVDTSGGWQNVSLTTDYSKYGNACVKYYTTNVIPGGSPYMELTTAQVTAYQGVTLTWSARVMGTNGDTAWLQLLDDGGAETGTVVTLTGVDEWKLLSATKVVDPAASYVFLYPIKTGPDAAYLDGNKLENAASLTNFSSRFFDVDDTYPDGTLNANDFSSLLRERITIDILPDDGTPVPNTAWTQRATFTIYDDGSTVSKWTKQGTGICLAVGDDSSATYAQQTRVFHGIIWDWSLRYGTQNIYDVTAYGLERLWQDYIVGPEAADGPRAWGIEKQTITTVADKYVYQLPTAYRADGAFVYKAIYANQGVNRDNMCVCRWPFGTTTEATHMLHCLFPLDGGNEMVVSYFKGLGPTDLVSHFESEMGMTYEMPSARCGIGGDAFASAHDCSFSHLPEQTSAWRNLVDAAGIEIYSVRYDENGRISFDNPGADTVQSALARRTSESDASYAGEVGELKYLQDVYLINDPCIKAEKYGIDSATGHAHPVQTTTSYYDQIFYGPIIGDVIQILTCNASTGRSCPRIHHGHENVQSFDDTLSVASFPTVVDTVWRANGDGNGTVVIAGDGDAVLACVDTASTSMIETTAAQSTTFTVSVKLTYTSGSFDVAIRDEQGGSTTANKRIRVRFAGTALTISYRNADNNTTYYHRNTGVDGVPQWDSSSGDTGVTIAAATIYWVTLSYDGTNIRIRVCDAYGVPLGRACDATIEEASTLQGDMFLCVGETQTDKLLMSGTIHEIRYASPSVTQVFREAIDSDPRTYYDMSLHAGFDAGLTGEWSWGVDKIAPLPDRIDMNVRYNCTVDYGEHLREAMRVISAPYEPYVTSILTAEGVHVTMDGSSTVADSIALYGYRGLKQGTWINRFFTTDAELQSACNRIAYLNAEQRQLAMLRTKFNPWWDPHDIFPLTYFDQYSAQSFEVIGINHVMDLQPASGGAYTLLRIRKWNEP